MCMAFTVKLADYFIKLDSENPYLKEFFKDYFIESVCPDFSISWTEEDLDNELLESELNFSMAFSSV